MNQSSVYSAISGMRKFWLKQIFLIYSVLIVFRSTDYDVVYRLVVVYVLRPTDHHTLFVMDVTKTGQGKWVISSLALSVT